MAFFVDDEFSNSKEVLAIPRRHRLAAVGLWTIAGSWSANKLTDGLLSNEVLKELGATSTLVDALVDSAGLWERQPGGIRFLNWPKWQRTRASVKAYRERERDKKRRQRGSQAPPPEPDVTSSEGELSPWDTGGDEKPCPPGSPALPIPKAPNQPGTPDPQVVTNGVSVQTVAPNSAHTPAEFCPRHPGGTPENCGPCANIRKANESRQRAAIQSEADRLAGVARARAAEVSARRRCPDCDENGWLVDENGDPAGRCTHPALREEAHA